MTRELLYEHIFLPVFGTKETFYEFQTVHAIGMVEHLELFFFFVGHQWSNQPDQLRTGKHQSFQSIH